MTGDANSPQLPSSAEAKRNLLISAHAADAQIAAQVHDSLAAMRKALPWIGGIAAVAGFFMASRKKRSGRGAPGEHQDRSRSRGMPNLLGLALQLAPIAIKLFLRPHARNNSEE